MQSFRRLLPYIVFGTVSVAIVGVVLYVAITRTSMSTHSSAQPLVNPATKGPDSLTLGETKRLQDSLIEGMSAAEARGDITNAGIYFRDLNDGPTFSINADAEFSPASLLKLPLAMWFYKQAATNPDVLTQEIEFTGPKGTSIAHFPPRRSLEVGKTYTIEALIEYMLEESDNDASTILAGIAGVQRTDQLYTDLGIAPVANYNTYSISVKDYAAFFRVLYNGTYIGRSGSEQLLEILRNASFTSGLVAGVPSSVSVAHKFGERVIDAKQKLYQLHDCGIVYTAQSPYLLCIMTQGHDYDVLASYIASVSKQVYGAVIAQ